MLGPIPFEVPARFVSDIASGDLIRVGALLKNGSTGQIVAHLQETGVAQQLLSTVVKTPFSPLQMLQTPATLLANVQLVQLKAMVEGLKVLQFANLGATVAGIGVSAIGFALMNKKINGLQNQIDTFDNRVAERFQELHERELRSHYSRILGLLNQADQACGMINSAVELQRVSGALADESAYFRGEVAHLLQNDIFERELFEAFTRSFAMCNAGRIECLMLAGEIKAALKVSQDVAGDYNSLFDPINPSKLAHKSANLIKQTEKPYDHMLKQEMVIMRGLIGNLRDTQDAALSKPYLFKTLIARKIDGPGYMRAIITEKEHPIFLLKCH